MRSPDQAFDRLAQSRPTAVNLFWALRRMRSALYIRSAEVAVRNPAFDVTPAKLVAALITEKDVLTPPNREKIAALLR